MACNRAGSPGTCGKVANVVDGDTCTGATICDANSQCVNRFAEFSTPAMISPFEIVAGPRNDSHVYVSDIGSNNLFVFDLTGTLSPGPAAGAIGGITQSICLGPDNNIWFTEGDTSVDRYTISTRAVTRFNTMNNVGGQTIVGAPDGSLWFTEYGGAAIGHVIPTATGATEFNEAAGIGVNPIGLAFAADGSLWGTVRTPDQVVKFSVSGTTATASQSTTLPSGSLASWMVPGPGGLLWFTELNSGQIGFVNPATGAVNPAASPATLGGPTGITYDAVHNVLWVTEFSSGNIARLTMSTSNPPTIVNIEHFTPPTANGGPESCTIAADGTLWFTEVIGGKIGRFMP